MKVAAVSVPEDEDCPPDDMVPLLVEGNDEGDFYNVDPRKLTLFDFVASYRTSRDEAPTLR